MQAEHEIVRLHIHGVSAGYTVERRPLPVLEGVELSLQSGEILAVLGPSGCGKTTLIQVLAGIHPLTAGEILLQRQQSEPLSPRMHRIGLIPQNHGLLPWKTVRQNCLLPSMLRGEKRAFAPQDMMIVDELGLAPLLDRYPRQLSGGQAQRAAVARALLFCPDLLLMDEPFSSLDAISREEAGVLFLKVWQGSRPLTVLVTHSIDEALYLGTRILVMAPKGGGIRMDVPNPYFAKDHPQEPGYGALREELRQKLKGEGGGSFA